MKSSERLARDLGRLKSIELMTGWNLDSDWLIEKAWEGVQHEAKKLSRKKVAKTKKGSGKIRAR